MECECRKLSEFSLQGARNRARAAEDQYRKRLESFREGILEGAIELTSRHIYRAGIYLACLLNNLDKNPSPEKVFLALKERLPIVDLTLSNFFEENRNKIAEQASSLDSRDLLRRFLRHRDKAPGLLEANVKRELDQARDSLERVERLDKYLASWKESTRMESKVNIIEIIDMHR